ncbi:MAG: VOC family protein [Candidatus Thermoplasmatota archaeon]|nr:VOC family protein [Candidatus Thermoplasmatota archaeon]
MIEKIEPVILFVKNFKESRIFYRDQLGLKEESSSNSENANFVSFRLSNITFSIHGGYEGMNGGPLSIHFITENIEEEVRRLKTLGVRFAREIEEVPWGGREATLIDPDGNEIDLYQP